MKAIMISGKPKWSALIMNGDKTVEVRKNRGLYKAIQKLINEYGYAEIYWYCSKSNTQYLVGSKNKVCEILTKGANEIFSPNIDKYTGNGKVLFKFRCYKVEEIEDFYSQENEFGGLCESYGTKTLKTNSLLSKAQLDYLELADYLNDYTPFGYAIHISNLEIFDKPKELSEFRYSHCDNLKNINVIENLYGDYVFQYFDNERCKKCKHYDSDCNDCLKDYKPLTKAPQNFAYIEVE